MDKIVYKVVVKKGQSLLSTNSRFLNAAKEIILKYSKKKKTVPSIGSLFVFEELKDAERWKSYLCYENDENKIVVIKGFARNVRKPAFNYILSNSRFNSILDIEYFWTKSYKTSRSWPVPKETVVCDSFTMRKVVE